MSSQAFVCQGNINNVSPDPQAQFDDGNDHGGNRLVIQRMTVSAASISARSGVRKN